MFIRNKRFFRITYISYFINYTLNKLNKFINCRRLVYTEMASSFFCCPGWSQVTHLSFGCNKRK